LSGINARFRGIWLLGQKPALSGGGLQYADTPIYHLYWMFESSRGSMLERSHGW
jgi:hypothetical protein